MKIEKFQLRGDNSVCAGAFHSYCEAARPRCLEGTLITPFFFLIYFAVIYESSSYSTLYRLTVSLNKPKVEKQMAWRYPFTSSK
jgi:hypothetical protein